jgi:hypothetical protein
MYDFVPAIRHGPNEQEALQTLSDQLSRRNASSQQQPDRVKPLLEITDRDDLNNLLHYTSKYDEVFVDFPRYLSDRDNMYQDDVTDLIADFSNDPVTFHQRNSTGNYTPIISGTVDPVDHTVHQPAIQSLAPDFDRLCVRLFVPTDEYTPAEKSEIRDIIDESRSNDVILADTPDVAQLSTGLRPNIEFIQNEIGQQDFYIFDLFEPRGEINYNYGLVMGKHADVDGVGDYILEPRFPTDIPAAAFQNIPKRVRQYESTTHSVNTTEDTDYYVNAIENMVRNGDLDSNHCPACEELYNEYQMVNSTADRTDIGAGFAKQMRINHYMYSVLSEEFSAMDAASGANDFDNTGYGDIT